MEVNSKHDAMVISGARIRIYDLAKTGWPECEGDPSKLAETLANLLLNRGIYIDADSRLLHYSTADHRKSKQRTSSGSAIVPPKWAIININDEHDPIIGGIGSPRLFNSKSEAKEYAKKDLYGHWDEGAIDELVIEWDATHFTFMKKGSDSNISFDQPDTDKLSDSNLSRKQKLQQKIKEIIDPNCIGNPANVPRGLYGSLDDLQNKINEIRLHQIKNRWQWIDENKAIRDSSGLMKIKKQGKDPSGKRGSHTNPGKVSFEPEISLELVAILIDLLEKPTPSVSEVLCGSHLWRTQQPELGGTIGETRKSVLSHQEIGCRVNDDLSQIVTDMVKFQFSIQPVFDKKGSQIGSLELKRIMKFLERGGSLPRTIEDYGLQEDDLLGPVIPIIDPNNRSDVVSEILSTSIDAVIFNWHEDRHGSRSGFPKEFRGVLEDGLHILTSHDYMAYRLWMKSISQ